jgi:hypothetical protein
MHSVLLPRSPCAGEVGFQRRTTRGVRRPFCPLPAGASPPSTASSGGHDAVPCLAGQSSRSRCRSHSLAMFDTARHHRTSITPGGGRPAACTRRMRSLRQSPPGRRQKRGLAAPSLEPHGVLDHGNTTRSARARGNNTRSRSCRVRAPRRRSSRTGWLSLSATP